VTSIMKVVIVNTREIIVWYLHVPMGEVVFQMRSLVTPVLVRGPDTGGRVAKNPLMNVQNGNPVLMGPIVPIWWQITSAIARGVDLSERIAPWMNLIAFPWLAAFMGGSALMPSRITAANVKTRALKGQLVR